MEQVVAPIVSLLESWIAPLLLLVSAIGLIYCIILGVKFAKAEDPQEHEKAKKHLKNAVLGYLLIFVLMLALRIATPSLAQWVGNNSSSISQDQLNIDGGSSDVDKGTAKGN